MSNPTSTEPDTAKLDNLKLSSDSKSNGTNPGAPAFAPKPANWKWSDDGDEDSAASEKKSGAEAAAAPEKKEEAGDGSKSDLEAAQKDGAGHWLNGSAGLDEPEFDVNVKLADLQEDPNNPLYSVKSFEELNL